MIPLSVPNLSGNEWLYIKDCLDTNWVSATGSYVDKFEKLIAEYTQTKYAVAVSSGTTALHISLLLAGVKQNDLVITNNLTFVATANAIKYLKADPILMDICPDTWQIDTNLLAQFLDKDCEFIDGFCFHKVSKRRIKAILPVHVLGNMADMKSLVTLAEKYNLTIVEDAAESLGSLYHKKHAGNWGQMATLSFNGNKIITTGGGGMILTNDEKLAKKAKHLTTQAKASSFDYFHDDLGYNYRLVNILAAMGVAQVEQLPQFVESKRAIATKYNEQLTKIEGVKIQEIKDNVFSNCWQYVALFPNKLELIKHLQNEKIEIRPLWIPINELPIFAKDLYVSDLNNAQQVSQMGLMLPCSTSITDHEIEKVIASILTFYQT
ncbi:aminotransferase in exopolysaccharide biosynthesis [Arcicella aurantiaca]|uniref:GDP-perosamine synthase n=1 Tax=Arcicella aurantiaca TaxID=591202 RepID=A0A316E8F4_9BACT|nr:LegC family aminotransferase [Arcicella aurantiaca]PWK26748.1 aminotransferase in exopolysaccharide biosynthesis [Arcicella aurantiaca]